MPFKNLEHNGNEDFDETKGFSVRKKVQRNLKFAQNIFDAMEYDRLEKAQKEYLSINNPLLWQGDMDD